jgi:hypothetical protein
MQWSEVIDNPYFKDLPFKIELNRYGKVEMTPASNKHGRLQFHIGDISPTGCAAQVLFQAGKDIARYDHVILPSSRHRKHFAGDEFVLLGLRFLPSQIILGTEMQSLGGLHAIARY